MVAEEGLLMSNTLWVRRGSITVGWDWTGNLRIETTHTPSNGITVQRADIEDFLKCLDLFEATRRSEKR